MFSWGNEEKNTLCELDISTLFFYLMPSLNVEKLSILFKLLLNNAGLRDSQRITLSKAVQLWQPLTATLH